jgi:L-aminopeptidase/D-esterase-like protein
MGYRAAAAAAHGPIAVGSVGVGTGATVGKLHGIARAMRGGLGCATTEFGATQLAAIVAVNAVGDVRDPATGQLIAGARDAPEGRQLIDTRAALASGAPMPTFQPVNTTIGVVVTSANLTKSGARRLAQLGTRGFARALSPPHLDSDGDTLFCLALGETVADPEALGESAAGVVGQAIVNAVRSATSLPGLPAAGDVQVA